MRALGQAIAERSETAIRNELGAQQELFAGEGASSLSVSPTEDGFEVSAEAPEAQADSWLNAIRRAVREEVESLPLGRAREIVESLDPITTQRTPPGGA